jgi:hypothetical protein
MAKNKMGIIEASSIDVVESLLVNNAPTGFIESGYVAKYNDNGKIELATGLTAGAEFKVVGIVAGLSGEKRGYGYYQNVVVSGVKIACVFSGTTALPGAPAYIGTNGSISNTGTVVVGTFVEPVTSGSTIAYIRRVI